MLAKGYDETALLEELAHALSVTDEAIKRTSPDHPHHPVQLGIISDLLFKRYRRTKDKADVTRAIENAQIPVEVDSHPGLASQLSALGDMLMERYLLEYPRAPVT
ncbi:hypothetical protein S40288_10272 [Stachybotrys chartarum IBT 40288]|nr:hypothetical protein S40288_10272 [Stachybotrys chartarum IBT 40288]